VGTLSIPLLQRPIGLKAQTMLRVSAGNRISVEGWLVPVSKSNLLEAHRAFSVLSRYQHIFIVVVSIAVVRTTSSSAIAVVCVREIECRQVAE